MAIRARITVGGVDGSDDDVPINAVVQLGNNGLGGEATWLWAMVAQPDGLADALSSTVIAAPQFTPKKEGTYLIHLTVTDGLGSSLTDQIAVAVRLLKTRERIPGQTETVEASSTEGWHPALASQLKGLDNVRADPGLVVGQLAANIAVGKVCTVTGDAVIKAGLPGQEVVPVMDLASPPLAPRVSGWIGVLVGAVDGGGTTAGKLCYFRWQGLYRGLAGAPAVGAAVYISDIADPALAPGTTARTIGRVVASGGGLWDVYLYGGGPGSSDLTTTPLLVDGTPPAALGAAEDVTNFGAERIIGKLDASNNTIASVMSLRHRLIGGANGGAGIGAGMGFYAPSSTGVERLLAQVAMLATDVTNGAEKGALTFWTRSGGVLSEIARLTASGQLFINATSPVGTELMRVNGTAYFDGLVTAPSVPTAAGHLTNKAYVDGVLQSSMHLFGASDAGGNPATTYLWPGFGSTVALGNELWFEAVQAGTYVAMRVRNRTGPTTAAANPVETYTLRKNAVDTAIVVTLAAGVTNGQDATHSVTVVAGDLLSLKCVGSAGIISGSLGVVASLKFLPS